MAGDIKTKERSAVTLTSSGASLTTGSAAAAGTDLDARAAGGSGNVDGDLLCRFELVCQWATITGITAGTAVAELYLVPKLDGTNLPDLDLTAGTSRLPATTFVSVFEAVKAPTANTDMRFVSGLIDLFPGLYTAHVRNFSGQTISANWTLKVVAARAQYT